MATVRSPAEALFRVAPRYPADPQTVEEIIAVMQRSRHRRGGDPATGLIIVLWRAGLRISEALALNESDLDGIRERAHRATPSAVNARGLRAIDAIVS